MCNIGVSPPPPRDLPLLPHCYPFRPSSFGQLCYQVMLPAPPVEFIERRRTIIICACLALRQEVVELASFVGHFGAPFPKLTLAAVTLLSTTGIAIQESRQPTASFLENRSSFITSRKTLSLRRPARLALKLPVLRYSAIIELALTGN